MIIHKTRAIALHSIKYSDTSIIVHIYTELFGRQTYIVKSAYSKKASIKANLFSPLNLLEMEVYHKETSELQKIREASNYPAFQSIYTDPVKSAIVVFIAELLFRIIKEEAPNQQLFDFLFSSIHLLDLENKRVVDFHLVFMIQFAKYAGFFPDNNYSTENQFFDLINGKFVQEASTSGYLSQNTNRLFFQTC
jgi:DNA repair protein RecO (recombination protein O)